MIDMVDQLLQILGYNCAVTGATSGDQGLALLREQKADILLLDLTMPNCNGWEVYRAMKQDQALADIPVIVISAMVPESGHILFDDLPPVDDYIIKPFNVDRLIRSIRQVTRYHDPDPEK
jgi:CheY-like chemotaxis protein